MFVRFILGALFAAAPALASDGSAVAIPEPGDAALFVLAVAALIVGRQASRRPPRRDD